jgi:type IV secretion system protein VirD4
MSGAEVKVSVRGWTLLAVVVIAAVVIVGLVKSGRWWILVLLALAVGLFLFAEWAFLPHGRVARHRVRHQRVRLWLRLHPGRGHATAYEIGRRWSKRAAWKSARRAFMASAVRSMPDTYALLLGRAHLGRRVRIPLEEHAVVMAPPRSGKSGWLARIILRYPGPVVSTTTRADVFKLTSGVRARRGPIAVLNPEGIGGVLSTFAWDPVVGCQDPATAIRHADGFAHAVSQKGVEDGTFWASKASDYFRCFFAAAALMPEGDMEDVARWATGGDASDAQAVLYQHGYQHWAKQLDELQGEANKTIATVRMTMTRALAFMSDPVLAAAALPARGASLDIAQFLRAAGTLYLIAAADREDSPLAPLFATLTSEIHHTATLVGSMQPGGRLDPPMLLAGDEITQICPVPLNTWMADSGGKGIQIIAVVHGEAQLRSRWGNDGAQVIMDTAGAKILLPGITDPATLTMASRLCGQAAYTEHGSDHATRHPVMSEAMIRELPGRHALVVRGNGAPVIVRLRMAWEDPLYKAARRAGAEVAYLAPPAVPAEVPAGWQPPDDDGDGGLLSDLVPSGGPGPSRPWRGDSR